jgi:hypothetical protein
MENTMSTDNISPDVIAALKAQILEELKDEDTKRREALLAKREQEKKARESYVERMKESTDPWVDIQGFVQTESGVKVELEWNDAFVDYLRQSGISGADDDAVVQKWITLLLRDMADRMEGTTSEKGLGEYV